MLTDDLISEIFGYLIFFVAVGLGAWQIRTFSNPENEPWLRTKRRYRRRMVISVILAMLGATMVLEARQLIPTQQRPAFLVLYVSIMMCLAVVLVLLSLADVIETANSAASQSMRELEHEVEKEKLRRAIEKENPDAQQLVDK